MKKHLMLGLISLAASAGASAQLAAENPCTGTAGTGTSVTGATDGTRFVVTGFTPKCSANVLLYGQDGVSYYVVAAGSTKGKTAFIGSSAGGGVRANGTCTGTGSVCTTTDIGTTAIAAAYEISS